MITIDKNDPKNDPLLAAMAGVGVIVTFTAMFAVYDMPFNHKPLVMIGEEGLRQMQKYLHMLLLSQVLVLVGLPALYVIFGIVYHKIRHIPLRPLYIVGLLVAGLLFSFIVVPIRLSGVEAQSRRFPGGNLQQVIRLLDAVNKDMDAEPVVVLEDEKLVLSKHRYIHSYATSKGGYSSIWEYELHKEGGQIICQITSWEYQELKPGINKLAGHTVRCYPNSGLLYDIDGGAKLLTEDEILATLYNITYDDEGYIHWEGPSADFELSNLAMNYYIDGERRLVRSVENKIINMDDPLFFDGHDNTAYLTAAYGGGYKRVSNILQVSEVIDPIRPVPGTEIIPGAAPYGLEEHSEDENANAEPVIESVPETEVEQDVYPEAEYLVTADELMIMADSPYYQDVMDAIDAVAEAPEITVGSEFKKWTPISKLSLRLSNGETDFVVYMNTDMEKYETTPQSEADVYFRISGKLRGGSIVRYLAYDPELRALWDALEQAR